jgi:P27 family predicted phage terminase small subunit
MGTRGPTPKPKATLSLQGSHHARYRRTADATHEAKAPPCPNWLSAGGKKEWRRVVKLMTAARTITELDLGILVVYCEAWGEYQLFTEAIDSLDPKQPDYFDRLDGLTRSRQRSANAVKTFGQQLGLSPVTRLRVQPVVEKAVEPKVMSRKRE